MLFSAVLIYTVIYSSIAAPSDPAANTKLRSRRSDPNRYDQYHFIQCPPGEGLNRLRSAHHNTHEDRYFDYDCTTVTSKPVSCSWTGYVNTFDEPISFMCPTNQYLAGVASYHDNTPEDRRFKFQCCSASNMKSHECFLTGYVNNYDQYINYQAPPNWIFAGTASVHHNTHE